MNLSVADSRVRVPDSREELGGKGFFLTRLVERGFRVPPFRVVRAADLVDGRVPPALAARLVDELVAAAVESGVDELAVGFAVRSSPAVSMPGMMDTLLGVGLTDRNVAALSGRLGTESAAWNVVLGGVANLCAHVAGGVPVSPGGAAGPVADYRRLVASYEEHTGTRFPSSPAAQVRAAVEAVFASWDNARAREYRRANGISEQMATAVVVQVLAYGTSAGASGSGVVFSHDPLTGVAGLHGEYLRASTGESLVSGTTTPLPISALRDDSWSAYDELAGVVTEMYEWHTVAVEVEFVVEKGTVWIVQLRPAVTTGQVRNTVTIAAWRAGLISRQAALARLDIDALFGESPSVADPDRGNLLATGVGASAGVATGRIVTTTEAALAGAGESLVLLRPRTEPEDFLGMVSSVAVVTVEGGAGSHAAVVARELGIPAVVGASFSTNAPSAGATVTVCGTTGRVWQGVVAPLAGAMVEFPSDLFADEAIEARIKPTLAAVLAVEPDAIVAEATCATIPDTTLVITGGRDVAERLAAAGHRVAFDCADAVTADLPDCAVEYVIAKPAVRRSVGAVLAVRAAAKWAAKEIAR